MGLGVVTLSCHYVVHVVTGPFEPAYVSHPLPVGTRLGGTCALAVAMVPNRASASIAFRTRFRIIVVLLWISLSDLSLAYGQGLYRANTLRK